MSDVDTKAYIDRLNKLQANMDRERAELNRIKREVLSPQEKRLQEAERILGEFMSETHRQLNRQEEKARGDE